MLLSKKNNLYTYAFTVSYILIFIPKFMNLHYGESEWSFLYNLIRDFILPFFLFVILPVAGFNKIRRNELYKLSILGVISFFVSAMSNDFFIFLIFLFLFFSRGVDVNRFLKILFIVFCLLILFYILNFSVSYYFLENADFIFDSNFGVRYTFGLYHPNAFPVRFFLFISLYILFKNKILLLEVVFLLVANFFIFHFSHSRTVFYIVFFLLLSSYLQQYFNFMRARFIKIISKLSIVILFLFWYLISNKYTEYQFELDSLNHILSGRIEISSKGLYDLGVGIIPRDIKIYMTENSFSIDVMYIYSLLSYGIFFVIIYSYIFFKLFDILYKNKLYREITILLSMVIYSCLERTLLDISLNYTLIFFSFIIYRNNLNNYILNRGRAHE